jgi:hypothetical protein
MMVVQTIAASYVPAFTVKELHQVGADEALRTGDKCNSLCSHFLFGIRGES